VYLAQLVAIGVVQPEHVIQEVVLQVLYTIQFYKIAWLALQDLIVSNAHCQLGVIKMYLVEV